MPTTLKNIDILLDYHIFLKKGFPIATGVIEGACRHLIKDRMDLTGTRWRMQRAESVLRIRSLRSSGDFESYWSYHLKRERERNYFLYPVDGRALPAVMENEPAVECDLQQAA
ncbi:hypothetical protein DAMNIGENAA_33160 [Desulforhabdus amnigena]|uniref:Uncharacterized protein n=1 Tax=Desulforhabdus amnigena TaxID=40218 RepID=A0A9W6FW20_9BACT|nr:hypothetical protein DAMNIGENAA_33160 [Desulforhabdus amnigena]